MNIDKIENGYIIDHIKVGNAMKIYDLLKHNLCDVQVAIITNAKSKKEGVKDIIKIGSLIDINLDRIAFIDKDVTINVVKDHKIVEKKKLSLPLKLVNVYKCKNPRCITSIENGLDQVFNLTNKEKEVYRCIYCESKLDN